MRRDNKGKGGMEKEDVEWGGKRRGGEERGACGSNLVSVTCK